MIRHDHPILLLCLLLFGYVPVTAGGPPPQFLEARPACLITADEAVEIQLERATTASQQRLGLMEREVLPADRGMLFVYDNPRPAKAGFWMYRTLIPLDIAWLDEKGVILVMNTMRPCDSTNSRDCPTWSPGLQHWSVLEMNAGFFAHNNVAIGDKLVANLNDNNPCEMVD